MGWLDVIKDTASKLLDDKSNESTLYLRRRTPDELLRERFNLPEPEGIVAKVTARVKLVPLGINALNVHSSDFEDFISGKLWLSESFLMFESYINPRDLTFALPLSTVRRVERIPSNSTYHVLKIALIQDLQIVVEIDEIFSTNDDFCSQLSSNLCNQVPLSRTLRQITRTFYSEYLVESAIRRRKGQSRAEVRAALSVPAGGLGREFGYPGDAKLSHERSRMRLWLEYLNSHGRNLGLVRMQQFFKLIRVGLPNALRGEVWELCCGSVFLRMKSSKLYAALLEENESKTTQATEEIAKDLHRSLPEYAAYQSEEGLEKLRRVLTAYSWMCPDVGYCQAMNIVAATLLIYQTEDQAFWTLHELVHRILPGYYSRTMYGMLLDQKVLEKLVERTMPVLWNHLIEVDVPLSIISLPWFLSLYANSMPLPFALRVIDILMLDGSKVLFQVALAVLKVNSEALMQAVDNTAVVAVLKHYFTTLGDHKPSSSNKPITNFQLLLVTAFKEFGVIDDNCIHELRGKFEKEVIGDIESYSKKTAIRRLPKTHNLNIEQVYSIYESFYISLQAIRPGLGGENGDLEYYQFVSFLGQSVTWMDPSFVNKGDAEHQPVVHRLFKYWDVRNKGSLTLGNCVNGLDKLACSDIMESINYFYAMYVSEEREDTQESPVSPSTPKSPKVPTSPKVPSSPTAASNPGSPLSPKDPKSPTISHQDPTKPPKSPILDNDDANSIKTTKSVKSNMSIINDISALPGLTGQNILEIADAFLFMTKPFTEKHNGSVSLDSISKQQLRPFLNQPDIYQEALERIYQQQSARYLASVSSFIQRCFEVAGLRQVAPEIGEKAAVKDVQSLIDLGEQDADAADDGTDRRLSLPHFRMVVLADETLELFFSQTLPSSVQIKTVDSFGKPGVHRLRSVMDTILREGVQLADGLRGRAQLQVTEAQDEDTDDLLVKESDRDLLDI